MKKEQKKPLEKSAKEIPKMTDFEFDEVVSILLGAKPEKTKFLKKSK